MAAEARADSSTPDPDLERSFAPDFELQGIDHHEWHFNDFYRAGRPLAAGDFLGGDVDPHCRQGAAKRARERAEPALRTAILSGQQFQGGRRGGARVETGG